MRSFLFLTTCLLLAATVSTRAASDDVSARLKVQALRLGEIERIAKRDRAVVEEQYEQGVGRLLDAVQREWMGTPGALGGRDAASQVLLAEFARMSKGKPYAYSYFDASALAFPSSAEAVDMRNGLMDVYFYNAIRHFVTDDGVYQALCDLAGGRTLRLETRREVGRLRAIVDKARLDLGALQGRRAARLLAVKQWEQDSKAEVMRAIECLRQAAPSPRPGVVTAMGSVADGPFCVIAGIDAPLRVGTLLKTGAGQSVRIVGISSEAVRFGMGQTVWEQELGAPAADQWSR